MATWPMRQVAWLQFTGFGLSKVCEAWALHVSALPSTLRKQAQSSPEVWSPPHAVPALPGLRSTGVLGRVNPRYWSTLRIPLAELVGHLLN